MSCFQNAKADALVVLAAALALPIDETYYLTVAARRLVCPKHVLETIEVHTTSLGFKPRDWRFFFIDYTLHDILPNDPKKVAFIRRRSLLFYYNSIVKTLYHRSYNNILLCCLSNSEAQEVLKKAHDGICEAHQPGLKLKDRLHRLGYYWPTMIPDAIKYPKCVKLVRFTQTSYINL